MKKILFFLFIVQMGFGQYTTTGTSHYLLRIEGNVGDERSTCRGSKRVENNLQYITAIKQDGTFQDLIKGENGYLSPNGPGIGLINQSFSTFDTPIKYTRLNPVYQLKSLYTERDGGINCDVVRGDYTHPTSFCGTNEYIINNYPGGIGSGSFKYFSAPYINLKPRVLPGTNIPDNNIGDNQIIDINVEDNIESTLFTWQYSTDNGANWKNIPNKNNFTNHLIINTNAFLTSNDYGPIQLRVSTGCSANDEVTNFYKIQRALATQVDCQASYDTGLSQCNSIPNNPDNAASIQACKDFYKSRFDACVRDNLAAYNAELATERPNEDAKHGGRYSNVLDLIFLKSAPNVVVDSLIQPTCNYSTDGKIRLKFDRSLVPTERLDLKLYKNTELFKSFDNIVLNDDLTYLIADVEQGNYSIKLSGFIGDTAFPTFTEGPQHKIDNIIITVPPKVEFTLTPTNVNCNGGNDGTITINASGGNTYQYVDLETSAIIIGHEYYYSLKGPNGPWTLFNNEFSHTINNLSPATYNVWVRDFKGCEARNDRDEFAPKQAIIKQPLKPLEVSYTESSDPTMFGGTNGSVTVKISGGTQKSSDESAYNYEWKNSQNQTITPAVVSYDTTSSSLYLTLNNVGAGVYTLNVTDANWVGATQKQNCTVANSTIELKQPQKIEISLVIENQISCNRNNLIGNETDINPADGQRDETQDGVIKAIVKGGVPLSPFQNGGLSYFYSWKKQTQAGTWVTISNEDDIAENLSAGNYAVNVTDKNGVQLGEYTNGVLTQLTDKEIVLSEPNKLQIAFEKSLAECSGTQASLKAIVTGGTPPYSYEWNNLETTSQITNLLPGTYYVSINDAKGCIIQGSEEIKQANNLVITSTIQPPTCFNQRDAKIEIALNNGGYPPFTFLWSNGFNGMNLENVPAGIYELSIFDSNGCEYKETFTIENPKDLELDLGADRTLCDNQEHTIILEVLPNVTYSWTGPNAFASNSNSVSLKEEGEYFVTISNGVCSLTDSVVIKRKNKAIEAEYFISSEAYVDEEVVIVNSSTPIGENTSWEILNKTTNQVIKPEVDDPRYIIVKFPVEGEYEIVLTQTEDECWAKFTKGIKVSTKSFGPSSNGGRNSFVSEFTLSPVPANDNLTIGLKLESISIAKIKIYSLNSSKIEFSKNLTGQKNYKEEIDISALPTGSYVMVLETANQTLVKKFIKL